MPIGIIVNVIAVVLGGLLGSIIGNRLSEDIKQKMNLVFGICAMGMGISSIVLMKNMPAVVFSVIVGTLFGLAIKLGYGIQRGTRKMVGVFMKGKDEELWSLLLTATVLFCASGTGIYGSLDSGMTGNHSILIAKAVLDFFTAMIFACQLGAVTSLIAIPQAVIMLLLFVLAKLIVPLTDATMIADFKACGGFILLATGIRIMKIKEPPVADMIPAMLFVMPVSWFWVQVILPLIS